MKVIPEHACFGGTQRFLAHDSRECATEMRFAVYEPPQARDRRVPVLYYLAGLTCTEETFMIKAGAQRVASELGLMLVAPDTSPRQPRLPGDDTSWDFGLGAGFYVDATQAPWSAHYRMYSYVTRELPAIVEATFAADPERRAIFGHSMGGHGALVCALSNPIAIDRCPPSRRSPRPRSAPGAARHSPGTSAPTSPHGRNTMRACWWRLARSTRRSSIDQGSADKFLAEQLNPDLFAEACRRSGQAFELRMHPGYDHGYWFIQSFVEEHLRWHAEALEARPAESGWRGVGG